LLDAASDELACSCSCSCASRPPRFECAVGRLCILPADFVFRYGWAIPFLTIRVHAAMGEEAVLGALDDVEPGGRFGIFEPLFHSH